MHKLEIFPSPVSRKNPFRLLLVFSVSIFITTFCYGNHRQENNSDSGAPQTTGNKSNILPDSFAKTWRALTPTRTINPAQWKILPLARVYDEYGLQKIVSRSYTDGKNRITVDAYEMRFLSGSYGLFTFNRGTLPKNRIEDFFGLYLLSVYSDRNDYLPSQSILDELKKVIPPKETGQLPVLPSNLPEQNRIPAGEVYLIGPEALSFQKKFVHQKDLIDFTGGVEVVTADYSNGSAIMSLIVVEYQTPQSAADGYEKNAKLFESLSQDEKQRRVLKRTGNYIIEAVNVVNSTEAQDLIRKIKYTPRVYWEGSKIGDIPIQYRPTDPAAIEEASETAMIIVRTFYWIGVMITAAMLIGVIAGGSFFYYRRHRRRKLGLDDIFSDSGGTVRLNLDEFLLEPDSPKIKLLHAKISEDREVETKDKS